MTQSQIPPFSKKILFISIIFLAINIAWYGIFVFSAGEKEYRAIAPQLIFAPANKVEIKTSYDTEYHAASPKQEIFSGTSIRTGSLEEAEIILEKNIIRMSEDTEVLFIENNFSEYSAYEASLPRMIFQLEKGTIWINAFDGIEVRSGQTETYLSHSVGIVTYANPMNRMVSITGSIDLYLKGKDGQDLANFVVPLNNQVTYVDSQIIPDYARLKKSKLKKELKLGRVSADLLKNEWVIRNSEIDNNILQPKKELIESKGSYWLKNMNYKIKNLLTFNAQNKRELTIKNIELMLNYLQGWLSKNGEIEETEEILEKLEKAIVDRKGDPEIKKLFVETFFSIGAAEMNSSIYLTKEYLLNYLLDQDGVRVLRVHLDDMRENLKKNESDVAKNIVLKWREKWQRGSAIGVNFNEFIIQTEILKNLIVNNAAEVNQEILNAFDKSGEDQIGFYEQKQGKEEDHQETLFNTTKERLDIVFALIKVYRYGLAKQYLVNSYESLRIDELDTNVAARSVFIEQAKVLVQRIKFAEERMKGAKEPIDETEFQSYYQRKIRDDLISEDLMEILVGKREPDEESAMFSKEDVIRKFAQSRIDVSEKDITRKEGLNFIFDVKNARLLERNSEGERISFDTTYDVVANAVNNVSSEGKMILRGHFTLDDLARVLLEKDSEVKDPKDPGEDLTPIITDDPEEGQLREDIASQNMAKWRTLTELNEAKVRVVDMGQIEILNPATLTSFYIKEAFIDNPDPEVGGTIPVQFKYSYASKNASEVKIIKPKKEAIGSVSLDELIKVVLEIVKKEKEKKEAFASLMKSIDGTVMKLEEADVEFDEELTTAVFKNLTLKRFPLVISGTYDLKENIFLTLSNPLLNAEKMELNAYLQKATNIYVVDYLKKKEIQVKEEQVKTVSPFNNIKIINYTSNERVFSFELDLIEEILKNITLIETGGVMKSMTFEAFRKIAPPSSRKRPKLPTELEEPLKEVADEEVIEEPSDDEEDVVEEVIEDDIDGELPEDAEEPKKPKLPQLPKVPEVTEDTEDIEVLNPDS